MAAFHHSCQEPLQVQDQGSIANQVVLHLHLYTLAITQSMETTAQMPYVFEFPSTY